MKTIREEIPDIPVYCTCMLSPPLRTVYSITPTTIMYSTPWYYFYSTQVGTLPLLHVYIHHIYHTLCCILYVSCLSLLKRLEKEESTKYILQIAFF